jgi:two-component system, NtrC family, sensor histidine kinase PilS
MSNTGSLLPRITRYILVRLVLATVLLGYAALLLLTEQVSALFDVQSLMSLIGAMYLVLGLSALGVTSTRNQLAYAYLQLIGDTVIVASFVIIFGGSGSPFTPVFAVSVVGAAWLDQRRGALVIAAVDTALMVGLAIYEATTGPDPARIAALVLSKVFAFFLVALLAGELAARLAVTGEKLREVEAAGQLLAEDLRQVLEAIQAGVVLLGPDGRARKTNALARELLPDVFEKPLAELVPALGENTVWEQEVSVGERTRALLFTRAETANGSVVVVEDITDLRRMQQRVAREERMSAVGRLSAGIAHEIRNPLTSLSGAVQLLEVSEKDERLRDIITREVSRLNRLVTDFMHAGSPPELKLMPTNLEALVRDVVDAFQQDPRYDTAVTVSARDIPVVELDQDQFGTVLWNLLLNAAQHMPEGGEIHIVCEHVGRRVRVLVKDEGGGIPEADLPHVWDPFYTRRSGGTGLGLATVERVVREHGGEVWVHSREGRGTTFGIWLALEPATKMETAESA